MRIIKITLFTLLVSLPAAARQLTPEEALARMQGSGNGQRKALSISQFSLAKTLKADDKTLLYVMNRKSGDGFVLLGADDNAPAVLGYSDHGSYDEANAPENFLYWMNGMAQNVSAAIDAQKPMKVSSAASEYETIGPLVKTTWSQEAPYNRDCTDTGSNWLMYTGCVATAMAQVMNYHQHPAQGTGSHTYTFSKVNGPTYTASVDFSQHTYDWKNMRELYMASDTYDATVDAVAMLMHDCGVSVDMNYSTAGSGTSTENVAKALITYFGYDRSVRNVKRFYFTDEEWESMMIAEIEAHRPVVYAGSGNPDGGHCFVMDGYDGNGYFHFNWGWNSVCDGFYLMTGPNAIDPKERGENCGFVDSQMAVIGIQPDFGTKETYKGMGFPTGYSLSTNTTSYRSSSLYINGYLWNNGVLPLKATMGVKYVSVDNPNEVYYDEAPLASTFDVNNYIMSYYVYIKNIPRYGQYYVYPTFKDMDDVMPEWKDVELPLGYTNIPILTFTGSDFSSYVTSQLYLTSNGIRQYKNKVLKTDNVVAHFELKAYEAIDKNFYVELLKSTGSQMDWVDFPVKMNAGETKAFDIDITNMIKQYNAGEYMLRVHGEFEYTSYPIENAKVPMSIMDQYAPNLFDIEYMVRLLLRKEPGISINEVTNLIDAAN